MVAIVVAVALFALGGWWGFSHRERPITVLAMAESIRVPGGELRVTSVRPEILASMNMPGMSSPDMAPEGYHRFVVDLEVRGTEGNGIAFDPRLVQVTAAGRPPVAPQRSAYPATTVRRGESLAVSLVFQAPEAAQSLTLSYAGTAQHLLLQGDLGSSHGHASAGGPAPDFAVSMRKSRYSEPRLAVHAGDTVRWTNEEPSLAHTVTFETGPAGSGIIEAGESFDVTFTDPGTFEYLCTIHPRMQGLVIVTPRD